MMRIFEIDGRFIDLDSITMIDAIEEGKEGWNCWGFFVHCKLHEHPIWFGDSIDTDHWRPKEDIIALRCKLINAWTPSP